MVAVRSLVRGEEAQASSDARSVMDGNNAYELLILVTASAIAAVAAALVILLVRLGALVRKLERTLERLNSGATDAADSFRTVRSVASVLLVHTLAAVVRHLRK